MTREEIISDVLCDLYDIQKVVSHRCGNMLKDNEGTETIINDCIENCIEQLEGIQNDRS